MSTSSWKTGPRDIILSKDVLNNISKETSLDSKTIKKIVLESNQLIQDIVADEDTGFKLPESLGYIVVTKYKSSKKAVDWVNSKKFKRKIYLNNLHSFGYLHHIKWFKGNFTKNSMSNIKTFKFTPTRLLSRKVAKNVKEYKIYHTWEINDFISSNKILKNIN